MAQIAGTVIAAKVTTGNTVNTFPVADQNEIQGGLHSVVDIPTRDTIPDARRHEGMEAFVISEGKYYSWIGGAWIERPAGSGGTGDGTPGLDGEDGADGLSAFQIAVNNGFPEAVGEAIWLASLKGGTGEQGEQGIQGIQGLSAYEVACANGFQGTEEMWLDSLVGPSGTGGSGEGFDADLILGTLDDDTSNIVKGTL